MILLCTRKKVFAVKIQPYNVRYLLQHKNCFKLNWFVNELYGIYIYIYIYIYDVLRSYKLSM